MFTDLIVEALNVMHPRFAHATRRASFALELFHQFRRLWDKALPVKLGLGHVMLHDDPALPAPPDFVFWKLGEHGAADSRLGVVVVSYFADRATVEADQQLLAACREVGYPHAVNVVVGHNGDPLPSPDGIAVVHFDTDRNRVVG